jgi:hypothetical protein
LRKIRDQYLRYPGIPAALAAVGTNFETLWVSRRGVGTAV